MEIFKEWNGVRVGNQGTIIGKRGKTLSQNNLNGKGYRVFHQRDGVKKKTYYFHIAVWECWGMKDRTGLDINHKNGIKIDNRLENLEVITRGENIAHAWRTGVRGKGNMKRILTSEQVIQIRDHEIGSQRTVGAKYGVSKNTIADIQRGIRKP